MSSIGVDLGTCLSSVAVMVDGKPTALRIDTGSSPYLGDSFSIPSSIFLDESGDILLGQAADNCRMKNPSRYRKEFKRDIGTSDPYRIGNMELLPEDLYREFLKYFKKKAEEFTNGMIDGITISHPANFAGFKKELIKRASLMAGFANVKLVDEPTAAAVFYSSKERIDAGQKLLVYDLGGGTFDVSMIIREEEGFRSLTPALGIERCGGADFQRKIYEDIIDTFREQIMPVLSKRDMASRQFSSMLDMESAKIKHQLSTAEKAEGSIFIPGTFEYKQYTLTRKRFEEMIHEDIQATCRRIDEIVKNAGLKMSDVNKVLLVGGSSRIPYVEEMVKKTTGKEVYKDADTELVVCFGAAIIGDENKQTVNKVSKNSKSVPSEPLKDMNTEVLPVQPFKDRSIEKDITSLRNSANMLLSSNKIDEAVKVYDEILSIEPDNVDAYINKGAALISTGKLLEGIECCDKAIKIKANDIAFCNKGSALMKLGKRNEAVLCYDSAIEANPRNVRAYQGKGVILNELDRYNDAIACFDRVIEIEPGYKNSYVYKGIALFNLDNLNEASAMFDQALKLDPQNALALENKRIVENKMKDASAIYNRAQFAFSQGKYDEAVKYYDMLIKLNPRDISAYIGKSGALIGLGRYQEGVEAADLSIMLRPTAEAYYNKGVVMHKLNRRGEAIRWYSKAVEINPGYVNAYDNMGIIFSDMKQMENALQCYNKAIASDPRKHSPYNNKGKLYLDMGKVNDSIRYFDRAIELDPNNEIYRQNKKKALERLRGPSGRF